MDWLMMEITLILGFISASCNVLVLLALGSIFLNLWLIIIIINKLRRLKE